MTPSKAKRHVQLEAKLAEAEAAKAKRGRPRSKPVAPPSTMAATTPVTPQGNGSEPSSALGNDIASRVASLKADLTDK